MHIARGIFFSEILYIFDQNNFTFLSIFSTYTNIFYSFATDADASKIHLASFTAGSDLF